MESGNIVYSITKYHYHSFWNISNNVKTGMKCWYLNFLQCLFYVIRVLTASDAESLLLFFFFFFFFF